MNESAYIRFLIDVKPVRDGLGVTFQDGSSALLEADHPNFAVCRINAEARCGRPMPVGVVLDMGGRVVDLNAAHHTNVRSIREFPTDCHRFEVAFWAYSPICGLTRDHPEFERLHATLAKAAGTPAMLWIATHSEEVVEGESDEDGLIPAYPKIMDVRVI